MVMNRRRWSGWIAALALVLLLAAGCAAPPTPRPLEEVIPAAPGPAATPAATSLATPAPPEPTAVPPTEPPAAPTLALPAATPPPSPTRAATPQETVGALAEQVILALRYRETDTLAEFVHPTRGVRFSPYAYVTEEHLVFTRDQVSMLLRDPTEYRWGYGDASGEPLDLTGYEYYERYVYDVDFAKAPEVTYNIPNSHAGTIDNSLEFYPGSIVVEYHFPGFDPQFGGMDWRSLRLVFQQEAGNWYLVGIIHAEWSP